MSHNEAIDILKKHHPALNKEDKQNLYFLLRDRAELKYRKYKSQNKKKANFRTAYAKYLSSPEWKKFRETVFQRDNYLCQWCGAEAKHCHHLSYGNYVSKGFSEREECISLCKSCHEFVHNKKIFWKEKSPRFLWGTFWWLFSNTPTHLLATQSSFALKFSSKCTFYCTTVLCSCQVKKIMQYSRDESKGNSKARW